MSFSFDEINAEVVCFVEACRAKISDNFIYAAFTPEENGFLMTFALESESADDREAITDIETDFEVMHDRCPDFRVEVIVAPKRPFPPPFPARVTWVRKRDWSGDGVAG